MSVAPLQNGKRPPSAVSVPQDSADIAPASGCSTARVITAGENREARVRETVAAGHWALTSNRLRTSCVRASPWARGETSSGGSFPAAPRALIEQMRRDEVYNLAARSHVRISFAQPEYTADVVGLGALRLLEAIRDHNKRHGRAARFYQAGSSEVFGRVAEVPQRETTPFHPRGPYACAKVYAHWQTINYREAYGSFAANGILFNHESPRRGENFVTRKITRSATRSKLGIQDKLALGNLDARRDWGCAGDYVEAMWMMLQQEQADDNVVATGETHSVQDFLERVCELLKLDWHKYVVADPRYLRPAEVDLRQGDTPRRAVC